MNFDASLTGLGNFGIGVIVIFAFTMIIVANEIGTHAHAWAVCGGSEKKKVESNGLHQEQACHSIAA
jgi:hypothetical protein